MAKEVKTTTKSEVLSMRMDQRTRFLIDFIARFRGQSITTVVERAIQEAAGNVPLGEFESWTDYWDINEGIRSIKLWSDKRFFPSFEEEAIVSFSKIHWPFFYRNERFTEFKDWSVEIIWPRISEFISIWNDTKSTDYFAAGKAMQSALSAAGVKPPDWPIQQKPAPKLPIPRRNMQLDDDIPF